MDPSTINGITLRGISEGRTFIYHIYANVGGRLVPLTKPGKPVGETLLNIVLIKISSGMSPGRLPIV